MQRTRFIAYQARSCRLFTSSCPQFNESLSVKSDLTEASSPSIDSDPRNLSRNAANHTNRKSFVKWLRSHGHRHEDKSSSHGTNYLEGKKHPFPLNPQFQPRAPISIDVKDSVYGDWTSGVGIRQLSQKYGLSLERVEAVLKLQQISQKWTDDGKSLMLSYAETMSSMLGCIRPGQHEAADYEQRVNISIDPGRQVFTLIPESAQFTADDAARELGKVPLSQKREAQIEAFLGKSSFEKPSAFSRLVEKRRDHEVIEPATKLPEDRWSYTIQDATRRRIFVRERGGSFLLKEQAKHSIRSSKWTP